jgi:hypothetical protein
MFVVQNNEKLINHVPESCLSIDRVSCTALCLSNSLVPGKSSNFFFLGLRMRRGLSF